MTNTHDAFRIKFTLEQAKDLILDLEYLEIETGASLTDIDRLRNNLTYAENRAKHQAALEEGDVR